MITFCDILNVIGDAFFHLNFILLNWIDFMVDLKYENELKNKKNFFVTC